jgi:hypothetical protein
LSVASNKSTLAGVELRKRILKLLEYQLLLTPNWFAMGRETYALFEKNRERMLYCTAH